LGTECRASADAEVLIAVADGHVSDALAGYVRRNEIELIVISSHARGGFARFSLGSVTDSLIRHTTVPVLVVKPAASYLNPQVRAEFRRIVVPLDGSQLSEQILPAVSALAKLEDAEITLINVLSLHESSAPRRSFRPIEWEETNLFSTQAYLSGIADGLRRSGITATSEVLIGEKPADEIAAYAARERADLIAIATHGRGGVSRILRGSVADSVTRNARTSVFALHPVLPGEPVSRFHEEHVSRPPEYLSRLASS
jgi:nucleotide-binding universal stress UspA family protein